MQRRTRLTVVILGMLLTAGSAPPALHPIVPRIAVSARPLPLTAVRLTGGPLKRAQDLDAEYLLELEPDRMLAFYRAARRSAAEGARRTAAGMATAAISPDTSPGTICPRSA